MLDCCISFLLQADKEKSTMSDGICNISSAAGC